MFETLGETYSCSTGDAFVIFPDILAKYEASMDNPWHYMWVAFSGDIVETSLSSIGITPDRAVIRGCSVTNMKRMLRHIRTSMDGREDPRLGNMEASGWLRLVLHQLGLARQEEGAGETGMIDNDQQSHSFRQIDQAIRLISLQYGQSLSIESIARTLGYHRAHLSKLFKEAMGLSPKQYLNKVRMKKAEELLESDLTIAQIASSVGFNDPLFFTKQFRKWSGMSPTEYRQQKITSIR